MSETFATAAQADRLGDDIRTVQSVAYELGQIGLKIRRLLAHVPHDYDRVTLNDHGCVLDLRAVADAFTSGSDADIAQQVREIFFENEREAA